ncbi:hypothetical protein AB0L47_24290 [Streptomyces bobili]|uniref:hypothetical protein n=1 Tax=Streptomyces bobili TaxID=67280 RepID=UPI00343A6920
MSNGTAPAGPQLIDRALLNECWKWPVRQSRPSVLEYTAAEWWVRERYGFWFRENRGIPQLITWQLTRFFESYTPGDPVLEVAMEVLEDDFKNVFSDKFVQRFNRLLKNRSASHAELLYLLKEAQPGGALKPDMLGITADRSTLAFDALEVGTEGTAQSTYDELHKKLRILQSEVIPQIKLRLAGLSARYTDRRRSLSVPSAFSALPSTFRLKPWAYILPLPVNISVQGNARYADWICFHPSKSWTPRGSGAPGSGGVPAGSPVARGVDGLYLYHIHRATLPNLPDAVRSSVDQELRRWRQNNGFVLELNPAFAFAMKESQSDWSPEAQAMFAYLGAGALLLCFVWVAWEVGLIAGGAAALDAGLTALAESPAVFTNAIRGAAQLAPRLWPAAVGAAPLMPNFGGLR